jgi:type II secretory pathway pseudopilin PulG
VTLVEMLVTLAILLLMMTVIVQIFQAATGALSSAQAYQELDNQLRLLDSTIRSDLGGVTCKLTPPNDPKNNQGYLEYGENEFADVQGEDSDDYIRFTAKAPAGQPFTGRMWIGTGNQLPQPITITSEYAEIIYFLRNGNLYRRVLLVSPDRQSTIVRTTNNLAGGTAGAGFFPVALGGNQVSWQAVNDLSAHPLVSGSATATGNAVILNTLGDLTNRENRAFYQRFSNDFQDLKGAAVLGGDGLADDYNGDNVPDYYPTLYPTVGSPQDVNGNAIQLLYEPLAAARTALAKMAFPFVYPRAYSLPQVLSAATTTWVSNAAPYGWIHSPDPQVYNTATSSNVAFDADPLTYLQLVNHNPLDTGDNLPVPQSGQPFNLQTWWGFPTWRETLSSNWTDPTYPVNGVLFPLPATSLAAGQPAGLSYLAANVKPAESNPPPLQLSEFLPAVTLTFRNSPQPYNDGLGTYSMFALDSSGNLTSLWSGSWEDDLVMTGVRSFDVKAYDNSAAQYVDLGWGDDPRVTNPLVGSPGLGTNNLIPYLAGNLDAVTKAYNSPVVANVNGTLFDLLGQTFAHEGRMPPLVEDNRLDASYPNPNYTNWTVPYPTIGYTYIPQYPAISANYSSNVGDDNPAVARLRRVWDSWSTEYTQAPGTGVAPPAAVAPYTALFPVGPSFSPPVYPSYPPPYPAPLRGIQIQIRITDPTNQRIKILTIRQDFTDKL